MNSFISPTITNFLTTPTDLLAMNISSMVIHQLHGNLLSKLWDPPPCSPITHDSSNKIQFSGYLVDLFSLKDSPRKDYELWIDRVSKCSVKMDHNYYYTILFSVVITSRGGGQVSLASTTWAELAGVPD
jgi:hypothetical protein